jgi:antitoxin MazE
MEVAIIQIGNSKGFRLPKTVLEKYHITSKMEMILEDEQIILRPLSEPRKGWDKQFKKMHQEGEDQLLLGDIFEDENFEEWS